GLIYNRSLQQERNLANEQRDAAEQARQEAQQHLQLALDAARRFYTNLSGSTLLNVPGQEMLRVELLQQARGFYEKVIEVRGDDPAVLADLANTIWQLGVMKGNVESKPKGSSCSSKQPPFRTSLLANTRVIPFIRRIWREPTTIWASSMDPSAGQLTAK